jgi:hypothetical protein
LTFEDIPPTPVKIAPVLTGINDFERVEMRLDLRMYFGPGGE